VTRTLALLAPNPSLFTGPGTNTYLVGDGDVFCIDPGPDDERHLTAILDAAEQSHSRIARILLTHSHPDHRPLAAALRERTGASVHCFDVAAGDDGAVALRDGETTRLGDVELRAVHTPGHARDHLCFFDPAANALYSGDHVLSGMTSVIAPDEGDMGHYMESLQRVLELTPQVIHPGHGPRVDDGTALIREYIDHRLEREHQVINAARGRGPLPPIALVEEIYSAYPPALHSLAALSVQSHLDKLVRDGRARRDETPEGPIYTVD
jgi:glyoxylase-like metal-dependent hydrolase (beta-lactamase superfamily II)